MSRNEPLLVRLDEMKDKEFIYNGQVVTMLGSCVISGGEEIEIYISGQTIYTDFGNLRRLLAKFQPVAEQARLLRKKEDSNLVVCSGSVVAELRDTMLDQIRSIRNNPSKEVLAQSKALNETVNQFANLARTELEYRKAMSKLHKKE